MPGEPQPLPMFRYHPDPLATGALEGSDDACQCCGRKRGYVYTSNVFTTARIDTVCPWCIADGSVHRKFDASFTDGFEPSDVGLPDEVRDTVLHRTPGYASWQDPVWMACCGDACAFRGDASRADLQALTAEERERIRAQFALEDGELEEWFREYEPPGNPAFYRFDCLHCGRVHVHVDGT